MFKFCCLSIHRLIYRIAALICVICVGLVPLTGQAATIVSSAEHGGCYAIKSLATDSYLRQDAPGLYADTSLSNAARFRLRNASPNGYHLEIDRHWFLSNRGLLEGGVQAGVGVDQRERWFVTQGLFPPFFTLQAANDGHYLTASRDFWNRGALRVVPSTSVYEHFSLHQLDDAACGPADISLNTEGIVVPTFEQGENIWGIADAHAHLFSQKGFGERIFHGDNFSLAGPAAALAHCDIHHTVGDLIGREALGDDSHLASGHHSNFMLWSERGEKYHQLAYWQWLKRAYQGGLRLVVNLAVTNQVICEFASPKVKCDDMTAVDRQFEEAERLERFIAEHDDGWLKIVKTPQEAREAISAGKLAVVQGIEVDNLFGCQNGSGKQCGLDYIRTQLDAYQKKGVTHIFPMHVFDNQFGGAALFNPMFNIGNRYTTGEWFDIENCTDKGFSYIEPSEADFLQRSALGLAFDNPLYNIPGGHCNSLGAEPLGVSLVKEMMKRGMIIDVDHMSHKMLEETLSIAEEHHYPLISGHTGFSELSLGGANAEGQKTPDQIRRIKALSGLISPILQQGAIDKTGQYHRDPDDGPMVVNNCSESSRSFAQAYLYAVDKMRPENPNDLHVVPLGSDVNGLVKLPEARFGAFACDGMAENTDDSRISYPFQVHGGEGYFHRQQSSGKRYDYNTDGMAHIGLLPDFIEDLKAIGISDEDLKPLFNSAEGYIRMWERAEKAATAYAKGHKAYYVATQSSTAYGGYAEYAVDGNTHGVFAEGSVTRTAKEENPWWQLDLGSIKSIDHVEIFNRHDCCAHFLQGAKVYVSELPFQDDFDIANQNNTVRVFDLTGNGVKKIATVQGKGRYIRVQHAGIGIISLAEVAVSTVEQSSTAYSGAALRALDKSNKTDWSSNSVSRTSIENHAWWEYDLGRSQYVHSIEIKNRADCCQERLSNARVFMSEMPMREKDPRKLSLDPTVKYFDLGDMDGVDVKTEIVKDDMRYIRVQHMGEGIISMAELSFIR